MLIKSCNFFIVFILIMLYSCTDTGNSSNSKSTATATDTTTDTSTEVNCANIDFDLCESQTECKLLYASKLNVGSECQYEAEPALCKNQSSVCTTEFTHALNDQNEIWMFSSGCIPENYSVYEITGDDPVQFSYDWEACD